MRSRSAPLSARALRSELSVRGASHAPEAPHEIAFGRTPSIVFSADAHGRHGNFLPSSYRRILANPHWAERLKKAYTASAWLPRAADRKRRELECATSSDALLMNVFCYPGVLRRREACALLGVDPGLRPSFGVRAQLPMQKHEVDRTEFDMRLGDLLIEAKLTETGFGRASLARVLRYARVADLFRIDDLPASGGSILGYQLIRGLLAAVQSDAAYLVLLDARRADLQEICFRVLQAVDSAEARSRLRLLAWQELAATLPATLQRFLDEKYGLRAHP